MKKLWDSTGRILFRLAWPVLYVYLHGSQRTRVVVSCGDSIIVVKDWLGNGSWKLPGGGLHKGEELTQSATRELLEETGLTLQPEQLTPFPTVTTKDHGFDTILHCYYAVVPNQSALKAQNAEIIDVRWMRFEDLLASESVSASTNAIVTAWLHSRL